jgi:hypothetical protein
MTRVGDKPKKRPVNTPATGKGHGGPAKGAGQGDGWGGPPKGGISNPTPAAPRFEVGNTMGSLPPNELARERRRRSLEMEDVMYNLAKEAEREETRLTAARALKAEYDGSPVSRNLIITSDSTAVPTVVQYLIPSNGRDAE